MIHENNIYLLFIDGETGERALMASRDLVMNGTPITDDGRDMENFGWTTSFGHASNWVANGTPSNWDANA